MTSGEFDLIDVPFWVAFSFAAAASVGLGKLTLSTNFQFTDVAFSIQGTDVSFAFLVMAVAIGGIAATNQLDGGELMRMVQGDDPRGRGTLETWEHLAVVGMFTFIVVMEFVSGANSWVTGSDLAGIAVLAVEMAGVGFIAYGG